MASGNLGTLYYSVSADTARLLDAEKDVSRSMRNMSGEMDKTDQSAAKLSTQMSRLATVIKTVVAAKALRDLAGMAQNYQTMSERVRMATGDVSDFEMVQRRLRETADGTYRELAEAQEVYIQTSIGLRDMGYNTEQALDIVDSLSYAFVRNETSADKAGSALNALTRATNRGTVLTDHWASLLIAVPTILDDIAAASGMTTKEISKMGYEGKLSADLLTQGLLQSRDANKAAADSMATDLADASVRVRNAMTVVMASFEKQTKSIQAVTNGIINAAEAVTSFADDAERMETALTALHVAAIVTASAMAGRLLQSLTASTKHLYASTIAARAKAAADLQSAEAATVAAAQNLIQARAAERAAVGLQTHAAAAAALKIAEDQATAATVRLSAAQMALAGAASLATRAATGLRAVLAFLGGPAGLFLMAAAAVATFAMRSREAAIDVSDLEKSVSSLGDAQIRLQKIKINEELASLAKEATSLGREVEKARNVVEGMGDSSLSKASGATAHWTKQLAENESQLEENTARVDALRERLAALGEEEERRSKKTSGGGGGPDEPTTSAEGQKRLAAMRDELELMKLQGEARARLSAIQKLGTEATKEEREEAERLATEIYRLGEAQEAAKKATEEAKRAHEEAARKAKDGAEQNAETIANLREQISQASLSAAELAQRQAELALNEYATPDQIERVRELALELHGLQELERKRKAFGDDVGGKIRGDVNPLSGGMFDDQLTRYLQEEKAEKERYEKQLERLKSAKELELEVVGGYQALELQMAQEHADRLAQIEQAKMQVLLTAGEEGFGAISDTMKLAFGEQSSLYRAAFMAQKAFAIASAMTSIEQGIAMAAANPWPLNLGAMASVAAATAGIASNIASITMGSGRQYGGPVAPGSMYRINETGAPEVYNAANGRQYLLPNQRGEVVSNREATGGPPGSEAARESPPVTVHQNIVVQGRPDGYTLKQMERRTATRQEATMRRLGHGAY